MYKYIYKLQSMNALTFSMNCVLESMRNSLSVLRNLVSLSMASLDVASMSDTRLLVRSLRCTEKFLRRFNRLLSEARLQISTSFFNKLIRSASILFHEILIIIFNEEKENSFFVHKARFQKSRGDGGCFTHCFPYVL